MKLRTKKGFLLVFALLITILISLIALSLLSIRKGSYASSRASLKFSQAQSLARSGITDVWCKLSKDPFFPGGLGDDQVYFAFREDVVDREGNPVGSYRVVLDRGSRFSHNVIRVESTGTSGQLLAESAQHTIYVEISNTPGDFRFKTWQEGVTPKL